MTFRETGVAMFCAWEDEGLFAWFFYVGGLVGWERGRKGVNAKIWAVRGSYLEA
jgi:hypothetical protein